MVVAPAAGASPNQFLVQSVPIPGRTSWCSANRLPDNRAIAACSKFPPEGVPNPRSGLFNGDDSLGLCFRNQKYQTSRIDLTLRRHASRKRNSEPGAKLGLHLCRFPTCSVFSRQANHFGQDVVWRLCWGRNSYPCHALLEGSGHMDSLDLQAQNEPDLPAPDSSSKSITAVLYTTDELNTQEKSEGTQKNHGRSGTVSFYNAGALQSDQPKADHEAQTNNNWWASSLWLLGPTALVSAVVLPPFCLRKLFEMVLEDSLVTDFLLLFFTETLFYVGVAVFLFVAAKVQQSTGVIIGKSDSLISGKSDSYVSLGYKVSTIITTIFGVLLPVGAFVIVWPWTGPAAAAALFPYMASLAVQFGFEQFIQEKKSFVWPLIPIVFQIYRLHQLNRATQLVAGLLYSLRGADATAETLAVNGSLQTLVSVLQLLGMLCLWSLAAFLTHIFASDSQTWQSKVVSSGET